MFRYKIYCSPVEIAIRNSLIYGYYRVESLFAIRVLILLLIPTKDKSNVTDAAKPIKSLKKGFHQILVLTKYFSLNQPKLFNQN